MDHADIWNARFQLYGRDNLDRTICSSKITYTALLAIMDLEGFGSTNYIYYVKQEGTGIAGLELLHSNAMVQEMLREFDHSRSVKFIVLKVDAPNPLDVNKASQICEERIPISTIGEPIV